MQIANRVSNIPAECSILPAHVLHEDYQVHIEAYQYQYIIMRDPTLGKLIVLVVTPQSTPKASNNMKFHEGKLVVYLDGAACLVVEAMNCSSKTIGSAC